MYEIVSGGEYHIHHGDCREPHYLCVVHLLSHPAYINNRGSLAHTHTRRRKWPKCSLSAPPSGSREMTPSARKRRVIHEVGRLRICGENSPCSRSACDLGHGHDSTLGTHTGVTRHKDSSLVYKETGALVEICVGVSVQPLTWCFRWGPNPSCHFFLGLLFLPTGHVLLATL